MSATVVEQVREAGVVGAGGAGFPTHVKLGARVEWFLANGAECEPLLHKDREIMLRYPSEVIDGLRLAAAATGASRRAIGVKRKNNEAISALRNALNGEDIRIHEFGDFYPSGDEYEVVYEITGRLIPPQGIPLNVGAVVNNVETLYQIHRAASGFPVTETFLTVSGFVREPLTAWIPLGTKISEILPLAGGPTVKAFSVMESGLMMGKLVKDLNRPVTKATAGLIVLPTNHDLIQRYSRPPQAMARIGKSACDQCTYCTELCPRYLLGYQVKPHLVMRSLGFSKTGSELWNEHALLCCGCGICTLYACPEALYPREACLDGIEDLRRKDRGKWQGSREVQAHPMKQHRRLPMTMLMKRLGVEGLDAEAPTRAVELSPREVRIPLKQHAGEPALPTVSVGDRVRRGDLIGRIPEGKLGANVHASIDGRVTDVDASICIERIPS